MRRYIAVNILKFLIISRVTLINFWVENIIWNPQKMTILPVTFFIIFGSFTTANNGDNLKENIFLVRVKSII